MRIQSIQSSLTNASFKGKMVDAINVGNLSYDSNWHKNSSIEQTVGTYHSESKHKAYFADPLEHVSDHIKNNVDYVIYDNEPSFPDVHQEVSRNYFGTERKNYGSEYQELYNYYERRAKSGLNDQETLHKKGVAKECLDTYNQGNNYRLQKESAEDYVRSLNNEKQNLTDSLEATKRELADQQKMHNALSKHIEGLESKEKDTSQAKEFQANAAEMYDMSQQKAEAKDKKVLEYKKYQNTKETYQDVLETRNKPQAKSAKVFKNIKENCSKTIQEMKEYISRIEDNLSIVNTKLKEKNKLIENCKKELIPLFDKLKNIYHNNAIQTVRRFY